MSQDGTGPVQTDEKMSKAQHPILRFLSAHLGLPLRPRVCALLDTCGSSEEPRSAPGADRQTPHSPSDIVRDLVFGLDLELAKKCERLKTG